MVSLVLNSPLPSSYNLAFNLIESILYKKLCIFVNLYMYLYKEYHWLQLDFGVVFFFFLNTLQIICKVILKKRLKTAMHFKNFSRIRKNSLITNMPHHKQISLSICVNSV